MIWLQRISALVVFTVAIVLCRPAMAQPDNKTSPDARFGVFVETAIEYSDNVFHLTESRQERLKKGDPDDAASGRFDGMDSIGDTIVMPRLGVSTGAGSPFGGSLKVSSWLQYNAYRSNRECGYPEAGLRLSQSVGERGTASMRWRILDGFFSDNDLSAVNDTDGNGNIAGEDRTYSPSIYNETEGCLAYKHIFWKKKGRLVSKLAVEPLVGTGRRVYDQPFGNRDRRSWISGLGVHAGFLSALDLDLIYRYEDSDSPGHEELVLFDETWDMADVNGDGNVKANAALVTPVDRSFRRHSIEIGPSLELPGPWTLFAGNEWQTSAYGSENELDRDHCHASADKNWFKAGIEGDFLKSWSARIEYRRTDEDEEGGENYSENTIFIAVKYRPI